MVATDEVVAAASVIPSASEGPHQLTFRRDLAVWTSSPVQLEYSIRGKICAGTITFLEVTMYTVYLLSSRSRVLYVGVTNELSRRLYEHRSASALTFCGR